MEAYYLIRTKSFDLVRIYAMFIDSKKDVYR